MHSTEHIDCPAPELQPSHRPAADPDDMELTLHSSPYRSTTVQLTREHLQLLVQLAYDQHGICPTPSYDTEAELDTAVHQALEVTR